MAIPQDARHIANQSGDFVPQHQDNYVVEIAGLEGDDKDLIVLSLLSTNLPTESNNIVEIPYGNEVRKVAGKAAFEDIPLIVHDYVDRAVRAALVRWRRQVYETRTGNVGLPSDYKKTGEIILQATNGTSFRTVRLIGLWPSTMNPGALDMSADEVVQIEMTLTYDRAEWLV